MLAALDEKPMNVWGGLSSMSIAKAEKLSSLWRPGNLLDLLNRDREGVAL